LSKKVREFDKWIRSSLVEMNTELEEIYSAQEDPSEAGEAGTALRQRLVNEGNMHAARLLAEGNTDEGFESAFDVLGNVGMYMASCRRHEITNPDKEKKSPLVEASALAMHLGASLGMSPRFATGHLTTHNRAIDGRYKTFTSLPDEVIFLDYNTLGVFAYKRAADAIVRILPMGISHPATYELLCGAADALNEVIKWNEVLFEKLDVNRFFYSVRPYYKPYRVGTEVYRGANAGDFAGINEIDMLLGLCSGNISSYSQILVDKFLYMLPEDQARLRDCLRRRSLLDEFLQALPEYGTTAWFHRHATKFLEVARLHGRTAEQHHEQLVRRFIEEPAARLSSPRLKSITASGPPLEVLLRSLEKLKDLRAAAPRDDIPSRYLDFAKLSAAVGQGAHRQSLSV
jgi:hypothetical protein